MLENLLVVASQVVTLFLLMAVGFFLVKQNKLTDEGLNQMTYLLLSIVTPCIIIDSLQTDQNPELLHLLGVVAVVTMGLYLLYALLPLPFFRKTPPETRVVLQFGVVYGNAGFMGLPLILAILGEDALIFAAISYVVFQLYNWTHGILVMGGRAAFSVKSLFLNPGVIGVALGLPLFLLHLRLPSMVGNAVGYVADLNTPLAMVVIGAQMAHANLIATFFNPKLYLAAMLKLVLLPLVTALVLLPLGLPELVYCTAIILAATPSAGATGMFAQRFGQDTVSAAQLITLSTVLSIVTLPLFAVLAQTLSH